VRNSLTPSQTKRLAQIQARLTEFRRNHPTRTRIPDSIRDAVLQTIADGLTPLQVLGACKISSSLLYRWRHEAAVTSEPRRQPVSILSVVDPDPAPARVTPPARHADLQFSVGGWNVHIRVEPQAK
jgi:hypothetical protein